MARALLYNPSDTAIQICDDPYTIVEGGATSVDLFDTTKEPVAAFITQDRLVAVKETKVAVSPVKDDTK